MNLPSVDAVNTLRIAKFKQRISDTIGKAETHVYRPVLEQLEVESGLPLIDIAAALASLSQGNTPLLLATKPERAVPSPPVRDEGRRGGSSRGREAAVRTGRCARTASHDKAVPAMETFASKLGSVHGIARQHRRRHANSQASRCTSGVDIHEDHSYVDLPEAC